MDYTKGEWKASKSHNFTGTLVSYITCGEKNIAQTRLDDREATAEENQANTQLIASAPDLYEACKSVLESINALVPDDTLEGCAMVLEQALAKAED